MKQLLDHKECQKRSNVALLFAILHLYWTYCGHWYNTNV